MEIRRVLTGLSKSSGLVLKIIMQMLKSSMYNWYYIWTENIFEFDAINHKMPWLRGMDILKNIGQSKKTCIYYVDR